MQKEGEPVPEKHTNAAGVAIEEKAPVVSTAGTKHRPYLVVKRGLDIFGAFIGMLIAWFPMAVIAVAVKVTSPGPVLFKQQRMGRNGRVFTILKFRTMRKDAPPELASREFLDSSDYITKTGAFLRRTSLDEVPQLLNILKGDMSFVGYRPVCLTEEKLNETRRTYGVFALRPGITGLAQVKGRDALQSSEKALLDKEYVERCSAKLDFWCCLKTVKTVITGKGVI